MKKLIFIFILSAFAASLHAQGEIFTSTEADTLFGPVIESVTMHADTLKKILGINDNPDTTLTKTDDDYNPMEINFYKIVNGEVVIFDENQTPLTKTSYLRKDGEVIYGITNEMIDELIFQSGSDMLTFELRENTYPLGKGLYKSEEAVNIFTVSSAALVVERGQLCPPYCPGND